MENDGIQTFVFRITIRPASLRPAHKCSGNRKSSSKPASERRLINPETMRVAIIAARIRNNRLLAEAKAASATSRQLIVKSSPRRVTCLRMTKSTEEWIRDQDLRTDPIVTPRGARTHALSQLALWSERLRSRPAPWPGI